MITILIQINIFLYYDTNSKVFLLDRSGLFDEAGRPEDCGEAGGQPEQRRLRHPRQTRPPSQRRGQL